MDLRVTSTGKIFRRIDSGIAGLLIEALPSVFEPVAQLPAHPAIANAESASIANHSLPVWSVCKTLSGLPYIQCDYLRGTTIYDGKPENAHKMKVGPHTVPQEIVDQYVRLKSQPEQKYVLEAAQERQIHAMEDLISAGGATRPKAAE